jgi:hypothetical protein
MLNQTKMTCLQDDNHQQKNHSLNVPTGCNNHQKNETTATTGVQECTTTEASPQDTASTKA